MNSQSMAAFRRGLRIIRSCTDIEQIYTAEAFVRNFGRRFPGYPRSLKRLLLRLYRKGMAFKLDAYLAERGIA